MSTNFLSNVNRFFYFFTILTILFLTQDAKCGIKINKKILLLNPSSRSTSVTISNPGDKTLEVWLTTKFGFIISNDSGDANIYYDTSGTSPQSASNWIDIYPKRFRLGPLESQVVRLTATPPPTIDEGEYWSRVHIACQDVNAVLFAKKKSGFSIVEQLGVPFHYRKGIVTTGLDISNFSINYKENKILISLDMARSGNASYWGTATIRVYQGQPRKMIFKKTKDVVV
jgi:hypothetical protein